MEKRNFVDAFINKKSKINIQNQFIVKLEINKSEEIQLSMKEEKIRRKVDFFNKNSKFNNL